jgi:hypothetical protein
MARGKSSKRMGHAITKAWRYLGEDIMYESYAYVPQHKTKDSKRQTTRNDGYAAEKRVDDREISDLRAEKLALCRSAIAPCDGILESMGMAETNPINP